MSLLLVELDEVVVAVNVQLVRLVARQLNNFVLVLEVEVANWTFGTASRHTHLHYHRLAKVVTKTLHP